MTAVLRQLSRLDDRSLATLYAAIVTATIEDLRELLAGTPAAPFLGKDNGKYFESVRSITIQHLAALEHLARQENPEAVSVRKWIREGRGVLFLPYQASEIASLRYVISTWMRLAIFETMIGKEGGGHHRRCRHGLRNRAASRFERISQKSVSTRMAASDSHP